MQSEYNCKSDSDWDIRELAIMAVGLAEGSLPQQRTVDGAPFPAVLLLQDEGGETDLGDGAETVARHRDWIWALLRRSGAVLLRGLPFADTASFSKLVEALGCRDFGYFAGVAPRKQVCGPVFTTNELPLEQPIGFHNEMVYISTQPDLIMFFCEVPSPQGGATPIVRGSVVHKRMTEEFPEFIEKMQKEGIAYFHIMSDHGQSSWQNSFQTDDRLEAEERARKVGRKLEWLADGAVKASYGPCKGIKRDTLRDQMVWFNSIGLAINPRSLLTTSITFGDGSSLPPEVVQRCLEIMQEEQVVIPWNTGDIMILDNTAVLHSRQPSKPPRSVLVALCKT